MRCLVTEPCQKGMSMFGTKFSQGEDRVKDKPMAPGHRLHEDRPFLGVGASADVAAHHRGPIPAKMERGGVETRCAEKVQEKHKAFLFDLTRCKFEMEHNEMLGLRPKWRPNGDWNKSWEVSPKQ